MSSATPHAPHVPNANFLCTAKKQLSKVLTNDEKHTAAFRIHNKQLPTLGELSFQTNLAFTAWKSLEQPATDTIDTNIFDYASRQHNIVINTDTLPLVIEELHPNVCSVKIAKCCLIKTNCHVYLHRESFTRNILSAIISDSDNDYGSYGSNVNCRFKVVRNKVHSGSDNASELRVKILHDIVQNFIGSPIDANEEILLTNKSSDTRSGSTRRILCGCVLNESGQKEETLTSADLYKEYASNMRMMFEHKYGVRNITDTPNWQQKIAKLGHAAVTFQMIQNSPQKTISLAAKHHVIKDAAFVVYNGARINSILRRFHAEFSEKLPNIDNIDFSTLKLNEEWELIYAFLAQYPNVIKSCVCGLEEGRLNFHKLYEFLVHFSTAFSCYYSRIKIITEAKAHLLPTLHARIYLLQAIKRVLQTAMRLLNVELVNHM